MLITQADLITRARSILQDDAGVRWTDDEIKRISLDGQVAIVDKVPWLSASITSAEHSLDAGIEQRITQVGSRAVSRVLDILINQNAGVRGKAIRKISKDQLDAQRPGWATEPLADTILNWMPIEKQQQWFLVYPPANAGRKVLAQTAPVPFDLNDIDLLDGARDALFFYTVWRCWAKDATYARNAAEYKKYHQDELDALMGATSLASQSVQSRSVPR